MNLYARDRHVELRPLAWSEGRARETIQRVFEATERAFDAKHYWPRHPDEEGSGDDPAGHLYSGAAGCVWGLKQLQSLGHGEIERDYEDSLREACAAQLESLRRAGNRDDLPGLLLGEAGFQVALHKQTRQPRALDRLHQLLEANTGSPVCDYMSGAAGLLSAAVFYFETTGDRRWVDAYAAGVRELGEMFARDDLQGGQLWRQNMGGWEQIYYGALHGFAGNAFAILKGLHYLDPADQQQWRERIRGAALRLSQVEGGFANWYADIGEAVGAAADGQPRPGPSLLQHCHGAPGIVTSLSALMDGTDPAFDATLLQAGELIWHAGPLAKGAGICHGTSGNGYALLKLHARTRDPRWLERARAFGMNAIEQLCARWEQVGHPRYSLWTGDLGTALYLDSCIRGIAEVPTMDIF